MFLRWGLPAIILVVAIAVSFLIPVSQSIQVVVAALLGGIPMWLVNSLLRIPNVVIEELGEEVVCQQVRNSLVCTIRGQAINRSSTGEGELRELILRIYLTQDNYLDIPLEKADNVAPNYRFRPHGRYPTRQLWFALSPSHHTTQELSGKEAEVRLSVIGQKQKIYKVKIAESTQ